MRSTNSRRSWSASLAGSALRAIAALAILLAACAPAADAPPSPATVLPLDALRQGGLYIVLRHTDDSGHDADPVDLASCATQAGLSAAGRRDAEALGRAVAALHLPIATVLASPYCRTMDTARLVFGSPTATDALVRPVAGGALASGDPRLAVLKRMLATAPAAGTDVALVTHSEVFRAAFGLDAQKGEAFVVRPGNGGYTVIARVLPSGWTAP